MSERNFFAELKRRNVCKVAVVGWLLVQAGSILAVAEKLVPAREFEKALTQK